MKTSIKGICLLGSAAMLAMSTGCMAPAETIEEDTDLDEVAMDDGAMDAGDEDVAESEDALLGSVSFVRWWQAYGAFGFDCGNTVIVAGAGGC